MARKVAYGVTWREDSVVEATGDRETLNELYNRRILALAADIPRIGRLERAQASATAISKLCGSRVQVDLSMKDGKVIDFAHQLHACALGRASSSVMARNIIGASAAELHAVSAAMRHMLRKDGLPPSQCLPEAWRERWKDLEILQPVRAFKARHASTLLTFDAVEDCLEQIESACGTAQTASNQTKT